ncbi:acetyl-CoA carboxylase carboxyltransferase subunit alpha [Actinoplanes sp. RD1]|uniref:acetyl-CoA carboxylase carboxyltransferase subunit alpha n=1 Tax=Actinoplanes sp. RD1 TaxID=3064538 RepID=UPI002741C310|nr:acetyl-CoA carboxylase carboxyltransferase subunit alpha [Actinoplanes sp. RD1]
MTIAETGIEPDQAAAAEDVTWQRCSRCGELVYARKLARLHHVCPGCGLHFRLTAPQRLEQVLDPGWQLLGPARPVQEDPLRFSDQRAYSRRLAAARQTTGLGDAVLCARGTVAGHPLVVAAMDFRFLGGSLGAAVGESIAAAADLCLAERIPLLIVTASGGARMQEGVVSLMQMVKTSQSIAALDEAGVLTMSLLTDPTYGGVAASFATLPDIVLAEPGAHVGFAGPRVIRQTIGQELPDGFQTAEFLAEHGMVDLVSPRATVVVTLGRILGALAPAGPRRAGDAPPAVVTDPELLPDRDPWETVRLSRHADRPTTLDYAAQLLDVFQELHGDRVEGDCPAVVAGLGRLDGRPIALIGHQKGHTTRERTARNFGMPVPAGYRKAGRVMRLAAKLGLPVVTLIDTPGAYPGIEAEEHGQAWVIADNLRLMSQLPVPVVAVLTGEGGSGGALALGVADRVLALGNATYSVISPEGCAAILWKDAGAAPEAARALRLDAANLLRAGVVDGVVPEPGAGAHREPVATGERVRAALGEALRDLAGHGGPELVADRRRRFRAYGLRPG